MIIYSHTATRSGLHWLASLALCLCPIVVNAAEPSDPASEIGLDELKAPPLLKAHDESATQAAGLYKPSSNTMTKATRRTNQQNEHEIAYDMPIDYRPGSIYNPATGEHDNVKLRSYNNQFVAPTVIMKPGQTVRFNLQNKLPPQGPECAHTDMNTPAPYGCFNVTNLHSHGLWVSPTGNSDNVLISINPGVAFEYEYNVPADHPAGTFWYHPHQHGSTAMQVASGMAGALVVAGDRKPTIDSNGDVDTLLNPLMPLKNGKQIGAQDEIKLLQQIPYACFDAAGKIKKGKVKDKDGNYPWICDKDDVGVVEDFKAQVASPDDWGNSGRYTLINGQARPGISLRTGQIYRWRLIDAGFNETIKLRIKKIVTTKNFNNTITTKDEAKHACTGTDVTQFEIASDGLTHSQIISKTTNVLQPGYRSDILFSLPEKGIYCVYDDDSSNPNETVSAGNKNAKVLAIIIAKGDTKVPDQRAFLTQQLLDAANKQFEGEVLGQVTADLKSDLKLTKFIPHQTITDAEVIEAKQKPIYIEFNLPFRNPPTPIAPTQFLINNSAFQAGRIDQTLILGTAQTWFLSSKSVNHPFHIHVNPFQIVSITDKKTGKPSTEPQYQNLVGTWKDTLFVNTDVNIEIRTRYERYIGEYVLHCHILEHEDQGMMQSVQVVLPNGSGGGMQKGHNH